MEIHIFPGRDFPKQHDVSDVLVVLKDRKDILSDFRKRVDKTSEKLANLSSERVLASYGFEEGVGVEHFCDNARWCLEDGRWVFELCKASLVKMFDAKV